MVDKNSGYDRGKPTLIEKGWMEISEKGGSPMDSLQLGTARQSDEGFRFNSNKAKT